MAGRKARAASPDPARFQTDAEVFEIFRTSLLHCLRLDVKMTEAAGTPAADQACNDFDWHVDTVLEAYADLVTRGIIGDVADLLKARAA